MTDIHGKVYDPTKPKKEVIYDYPAGVGSGIGREVRRVEMIPNPPYGTVTCGKDCVSSKQSCKNTSGEYSVRYNLELQKPQ